MNNFLFYFNYFLNTYLLPIETISDPDSNSPPNFYITFKYNTEKSVVFFPNFSFSLKNTHNTSLIIINITNIRIFINSLYV